MAFATSDVAAFIGVAFVVLIVLRNRKRSNLPLPPGPKGHPIIGSLLSWPSQHQWYWLETLHQQYGGLVGLTVAGQPIISISDPAVLEELYSKRGAIYSDRPPLPFFTKWVSQGLYVTMKHANQPWKMARRAMTEVMSTVRAGASEAVQEMEAAITARQLVLDSSAWKLEARRYIFSSLSSMTWARPFITRDDPQLAALEGTCHATMEALVPGANIIDTFPFLDHLPNFLAPWRKRGQKSHDFIHKVYADLSSEAVAKVEANPEDAPPLWLDTFIARSNYTDSPFRKTLRGLGLIDMFNAGIDTTSIALQEFFLVSITQPGFLEHARRNVDEAIGPNRLPTFADRKHLAYVDAVIRELLRFRPQVPIGIPHCSSKDDVVSYQGKEYFIPKGSILFSNLWTMSRNLDISQEPDRFDPSRHLDSEGNLTADKTHMAAFGAGWRVCPGNEFAIRSLFIMIAYILWGFDIAAPTDPETGKPILPDDRAFCDSITPEPKPFKVIITPRDEHRAELILKHYEEIDKDVAHLLRESATKKM